MTFDLIVQTSLHPTAMLGALERLALSDTAKLRIAVAYTTTGGCDDLMPRLASRIGNTWPGVAKTIITSFDFGLTEPAALRDLRDQYGFVLRRTAIPGASFHPKLFSFTYSRGLAVMVGSANLTRAALTVNTEAASVMQYAQRPVTFEQQWAELEAASTALSEPDIAAYETRRRTTQRPAFPPDPPIAPPSPPPPRKVSPFLAAIQAGNLNPAAYSNLWVEAGSMSSSGSHSQLELPRGGNRFFGFSYSNYDGAQRTIGYPVLFAGGAEWSDRSLAWHGDNGMERLNLPTPSQGGFQYRGTAILFRRIGTRFQIQVAAWNSPIAMAWRGASAQTGLTFRLGTRSTRTCGLF